MPEKRIRPAHETVAELRSADVPPVSPVPSQVSSPVSSSGSPSGSPSGSLAPDTGVRHRLHPHADPRRAPSLDELIDAFQEPGRPDYYDVRDLFQREHGQIRESYFARNFHAGAVMVKPRGWVARLSRTRKIKLRYDGLQAAAVQPGFEAAIWRARAMDRESGLILGGRSRKVLVEMLFAIMVYLLGVLDAMAPTDRADVPHTSDQQRRARVEAALTQARAELARLERFATSAARKASLRWYLLGLPLGVLVAVILVLVADAWSTPLVGVGSDAVKVCCACGAVGAVMSVMIRITRGQRLEIDSEQGHAVTLLAGTFRPLIGAVFGVALYVFVKSGLIPIAVPPRRADELLLFAALSFLAGFSERWAQDSIVHSAPVVSGPTRATSRGSGKDSGTTDQ